MKKTSTSDPYTPQASSDKNVRLSSPAAAEKHNKDDLDLPTSPNL